MSDPRGPGAAPGGPATATLRPFSTRLLARVPATRGPVAAVAMVTGAQGLVAVAQALALAAVVVAVVRAQDPSGPLGWAMAALVVRGLLAGLGAWLAGRAGVRVATILRARAVDAVLALPADRRPDPTALQVRLDAAPTAVEPYVAGYLPALATAGVVPVAALATMAWLDWRIALIVVVTLPLLPLFAALIGAATADETNRRWATMAVLGGHFLDVVQGVVTLANFGRARHQAATIRDVSERVRRATVATLRTAFLSAAALELLASISVAIVAVFVGLGLAEGSMDLAVGLPLILVAPEAYWPIRRVGTAFHAAADGAAALDDLLDLVDEATPRASPPDPAAATAGDARGGAVRLVGVAIGHDHDLVTNLDATWQGGLVVVTGASGVGKTTLLEVVAGLRSPRTGTVDAPVCHLVTQRPLLVPGTVRDNLLLGSPPDEDATDEALGAALRRVGLAALARPGATGLDRHLGPDGVGLSAGQRLRLGLARALVADAPVLLVDEPTAHLDDRGRGRIVDLLADLAGQRPVVAATHDAAVVARADRVLDLDAVAA